MRSSIALGLALGAVLAAGPAFALDLNGFRRAHHLPPLSDELGSRRRGLRARA